MTTTNENYVYAEDDMGVSCRFTEEEGWQPLEPSCLSCGARSDECNCGKYILAEYIDEEEGDDDDIEVLKNKIKNQIIQLWKDYDKDGDMEEVIDEFKLFYGNHDNSLIYYDFEIESHNIMCVQRFVIAKTEENEYDLLVCDMLNIATIEGLKRHLLYWIMEDIDFTTISSN